MVVVEGFLPAGCGCPAVVLEGFPTAGCGWPVVVLEGFLPAGCGCPVVVLEGFLPAGCGWPGRAQTWCRCGSRRRAVVAERSGPAAAGGPWCWSCRRSGSRPAAAAASPAHCTQQQNIG